VNGNNGFCEWKKTQSPVPCKEVQQINLIFPRKIWENKETPDDVKHLVFDKGSHRCYPEIPG
jgi:hypothetical protein